MLMTWQLRMLQMLWSSLRLHNTRIETDISGRSVQAAAVLILVLRAPVSQLIQGASYLANILIIKLMWPTKLSCKLLSERGQIGCKHLCVSKGVAAYQHLRV